MNQLNKYSTHHPHKNINNRSQNQKIVKIKDKSINMSQRRNKSRIGQNFLQVQYIKHLPTITLMETSILLLWYRKNLA